MKRTVVLGLLAAVLSGCAALPQLLQLPTVAFEGVSLRNARLHLGGRGLALDVGLRLRIRNPYGIGLHVPTHRFRFLLDGRELPVHLGQMRAFTLPAERDEIVEYPIVFELNPDRIVNPLELLGRNVPFTFIADLQFEMPYGAGVRDYRFVHDDRIRMPSLADLTRGRFRIPGL